MTPAESGKAVGGLVAVALKEAEGERPGEQAVHQQGQEEGADVLSVGQPEVGARIAAGGVSALAGENVDEDGTRSGEEDVERGGVLEDPAGGEGFVAEVEGQLGCDVPLRGGPL